MTLQQHQLGNIATLTSGMNISRGATANTETISCSVISVGDLKNYDLPDLSALSTVKLSDSDALLSRQARVGDVLLTSKGTAFKVAEVEARTAGAIVSANLIIARPSDRILPAVLSALLSSSRFEQRITMLSRSTSRLLSISIKDLSKIEIPVPPMPLQHKIADIIVSQRDAYRAAQKAMTERSLIARQAVDDLLFEKNPIRK